MITLFEGLYASHRDIINDLERMFKKKREICGMSGIKRIDRNYLMMRPVNN